MKLLKSFGNFSKLFHSQSGRPAPTYAKGTLYSHAQVMSDHFKVFKVSDDDVIIASRSCKYGSYVFRRTALGDTYYMGRHVKNPKGLNLKCDASVEITKEVRDSVQSRKQESKIKGQAFIAIVVRDRFDYIVRCIGGNIGEQNVPCSELEAIYRALQIVRDSNAKHAVIWSDSNEAVREVNARKLGKLSGCKQLLIDTRELLKSLRESGRYVELLWCCRACNRLADFLSKTVGDGLGIIVPPKECKFIYGDDREGVVMYQLHQKHSPW